MRRILIAALTILSLNSALGIEIAAPPDCVSFCGIHAITDHCREFQKLEQRALSNFGKVKGWEGLDLCGALAGWVIMPHARIPADDACGPDAWAYATDPLMCVIGYTHEGLGLIELQTTSDWKATPLAHELAHVLDIKALGHAGHCHWTRRGIKAAIKATTGVADGAKEPCP